MNQEGSVATTARLARGQTEVTWEGRDENGRPLPTGRYSAAIQSVADGTFAEARVLAHSEIEEARINGDQVDFVLIDGTVISEDAIQSIR